MIRNILKSMRPRQWVKSGFILAPALFTLRIMDLQIWLELALCVFGFSLVSSAIYIFNDLVNREEDAQHPNKKSRPIASGKLTTQPALMAMAVVLSLGFVLVWSASPMCAMITATYFIMMVLYTIWLRKLLIVDIIIVAFGFVLRVVLGAVLISEAPSHWLLLCTFTIALYLGLIKRRQELAALENSDDAGRKVLQIYPLLPVIDSWITVLTTMTLIFYALYTVDPLTVQKHHTEGLIYTLPLVLYGIFRYQKLAVTDRAGEDPTALVVRDNGLKIIVILWIIAVIAILSYAQ